MPFSIKAPFELIYDEIADIRFLARSAVNPKYCLFFVDIFTFKIYTYSIKKRNLLKKKMEIFYNDMFKKRDTNQFRISAK